MILLALLLYYAGRLLQYTGTRRILVLSGVVIVVCGGRSLWHLCSLWLPQAYTEDILTLSNGAKDPSMFQFVATLLSELPMWAVLLFFRRDGPSHAAIDQSGTLSIHGQVPVCPLRPDHGDNCAPRGNNC